MSVDYFPFGHLKSLTISYTSSDYVVCSTKFRNALSPMCNDDFFSLDLTRNIGL